MSMDKNHIRDSNRKLPKWPVASYKRSPTSSEREWTIHKDNMGFQRAISSPLQMKD